MIGNVNVLVFMFLHFTASVMVLTLAALGYMVWVDYFQSKKKSRKRGNDENEYDDDDDDYILIG